MRTQIDNPLKVLGVALAVGWVADRFFYAQKLGVNVLVFAALVVAGLWVIGRKSTPIAKQNSWLIIPLLSFAAFVFLRANPFLMLLNIAVTLFIATLIFYYYSADNIADLSIVGYFKIPLKTFISGITSGFGVAAQASNALSDSSVALPAVRQNSAPIARGLVMATPIVLVFMGLLVSADMIFAQRVAELVKVESFPGIRPLLGHTAWLGSVTWLAAGSYAYALNRDSQRIQNKFDEATGHVKQNMLGRLKIGFIESNIILNSVNLLFAGFVSVQFSYLFGGLKNIKLDGFTYADYARKGFFELVVVALLTLGLTLLLKAQTRREGKRQTTVFNASSTLVVAFVIIMLISAFQRMQLYELTYGFTELRLYSHIFMVWLGVVFGWFVWTLWFRPNRFAIGLLLCGLGYVMTLNVLNIDQFIVQQNVRRAEVIASSALGPQKQTTVLSDDTGEVWDGRERNVYETVDTYYFEKLSADSVPALLTLLPKLDGIEQVALDAHLRGLSQEYETERANLPWFSYHNSYAQAQQALNGYYGTEQ